MAFGRWLLVRLRRELTRRTTRAATVTWMLFGVDAVLVGIVFLAAKSRIQRASNRQLS